MNSTKNSHRILKELVNTTSSTKAMPFTVVSKHSDSKYALATKKVWIENKKIVKNCILDNGLVSRGQQCFPLLVY